MTTDSHSGPDAGSAAPFDRTPPAEADATAGPSTPVDFRSVLVEYEGTADRRTVYPADATETERLTRWLTADDDAFARLDEMI